LGDPARSLTNLFTPPRRRCHEPNALGAVSDAARVPTVTPSRRNDLHAYRVCTNGPLKAIVEKKPLLDPRRLDGHPQRRRRSSAVLSPPCRPTTGSSTAPMIIAGKCAALVSRLPLSAEGDRETVSPGDRSERTPSAATPPAATIAGSPEQSCSRFRHHFCFEAGRESSARGVLGIGGLGVSDKGAAGRHAWLPCCAAKAGQRVADGDIADDDSKRPGSRWRVGLAWGPTIAEWTAVSCAAQDLIAVDMDIVARSTI
jgi:hypothetical protein